MSTEHDKNRKEYFQKIESELKQNSDFSFEMLVLRRLITLGFACEHSGIYVDPISSKNREFDIRAKKLFNQKSLLHVAVECKNISPDSPLIIHRVPRCNNEAFHTVLVRSSKNEIISDSVTQYLPSSVQRLENADTPYQTNESVGKAMDQPIWSKDKLKLSDRDMFDKYSQVLGSLSGLIEESISDLELSRRHAFLALLVVPDESLCVFDYSNEGDAKGALKIENYVQYYVNKSYLFKSYPQEGKFVLSHVDIVTLSGLEKLINKYCQKIVSYAPLFPSS